MPWMDIDKGNYADTVRLLGLIDAGESYLLQQGAKDNYAGWRAKRYFESESNRGVMIACILGDTLHVGISFDPDVPVTAEGEIIKLLQGLDKSKIWCRADNMCLISLVSDTLSISPDYWAHEMSVSKGEFQNWKAPEMPAGFYLKGYDAVDHESYIGLLEEAMAHVSAKGTFTNKSDSLKESWSDPSERNYFVSLWNDCNLVGMCHSNGLEIVNIAIDCKYRGKGFGYILLYNTVNQVFTVRNEEGLLCLYVVDSNIHAHNFYLRSGMKITGHAARFAV